MRQKRKNKGSAVIEMTLLIPIFLGVLYFYILFFLFLIEYGKNMKVVVEYAYGIQMKYYIENLDCEITTGKQGDINVFWIEKSGAWFDICAEFRRDNNNPVDNIRRWQIAVDTVY